MLAHVLVLLCGCACALSVGPDGNGTNATGPLHYVRAYYAYKELAKNLEESIVSMSGNIPPLSDSRRHHAVIFNVINTEALVQSGCLHGDYEDDYIRVLDESAPEAISDPKQVISAAQELLNSVEEYTKNISQVIEYCLDTEEECDVRVGEIIKEANETFVADVLLLVGQAASELNGQRALFNYVADNQRALNFVLNAMTVLENSVMGLADLYRYLDYLKRQGVLKC